MKKIYLFTILSMLLTSLGYSQVLLEENFDYGGTAGVITTASGGAWVHHSGATNDEMVYNSSSLIMAGYPGSGTGGSVFVDHTATGEDVNRPFTSPGAGMLYFSALVEITSAGTNNGYFLHTGTTSDAGATVSGFNTRVFAVDDGTGTKFDLGIGSTSTPSMWGSSLNYNQTYVLVVRFDMDNGNLDAIILNSTPTSEPGGAAWVSNAGTASATLNTIALRSSGSGSSGMVSANVDGIRVGTSWDDLFPAAASDLTVSATGTTAVTCNGGNDGSVTVDATGGTTPYTYAWALGSNTDTQTGLSAGAQTLTVTVSDATTITEVHTVNVTIAEPDAIGVIDNSTAATCSGSDGMSIVSGTGGSGTYTSYMWDNGATGTTATGLAAGTYDITITDNNSCSGVASVTISSNTVVLTAATTIDNASCGGTDGGVTVTPSNGTSPYTYAWNNSPSTTNVATGLAQGNYTVTIMDANQCSGTKAATVNSANGPSITVTAGDVTCAGGSDGSAMVVSSGGTTPYTYAWESSAETTANITGLMAGTYGVTVTDDATCSTIGSVTIADGATVMVTVSGTNISCNGVSDGTVMTTVSGGTTPYSYAWNGGATTSSATGLAAGAYSVVVMDGNSCSANGSITLTEPATAVSGTLTGTNETTAGASDGTLSISAAGGTSPYSYAWTTSMSGTASSVSGISPGVYTATITDDNGCSATTNSVTVEAGAGVSITPIYDIQYVAGATPGNNDASPMNGLTVTIQGYVTALIDKGSTKGYWVQDAEALYSGVFVYDPTNIPTRGDELRVTGEVTEFFNSTQLTNVSAIVTVSSGNTVNPVAISTLDSKTEGVEGVLVKVSNATCDTVASGATFGVWTVNDGSGPAQIENDIYAYGQEVLGQNYDVTGVGYYTFDVMYIAPRDINDVNVSCGYSVAETITDVTCNGAADGSIALTTSGTSNTFTYNWSDGSSAATAANLDGGSYSVTVTDENNCVFNATYVVAEPAAISLSTSSSNTTCGNMIGSATVSATGGSGTFSAYSWSNGGTTATITGLGNGTYTVTVTDSDNCSSTASIGINSSDGPSITITSTAVTCNGLSDGMLSAAVTGGVTPYTYLWTGGATSSSMSGLAAGSYDLTVTDNNACNGFATTAVTEPTALTIAVTVTDESAAGAGDGTATAVAAGGNGSFTYNWSTSETGSSISSLAAGSYSVTVEDANMCTASTTFTVEVFSNLTPIYDIQYVTGANDESPLKGQVVEVQGIVTALNTKTNDGYWIQDAVGAWNGIYVFDNVNVPSRGDEVNISATVDEYFGSTQLKTVTSYSVVSTGNTMAYEAVSTADVALEDYENVLIRVANAVCTEEASGATFGVWKVDDGSGEASVENDLYSYNPSLNQIYGVTGIGYYSFSTRFIAPRDLADIFVGSGIEEDETNDLSVYPNPTSGMITIQGLNGNSTIKVISLTGAVVFETSLMETTTTVDLSSVAEGVYNLQVVENGVINNSRIVVTK